jgi:hypothetical protein
MQFIWLILHGHRRATLQTTWAIYHSVHSHHEGWLISRAGVQGFNLCLYSCSIKAILCTRCHATCNLWGLCENMKPNLGDDYYLLPDATPAHTGRPWNTRAGCPGKLVPLSWVSHDPRTLSTGLSVKSVRILVRTPHSFRPVRNTISCTNLSCTVRKKLGQNEAKSGQKCCQIGFYSGFNQFNGSSVQWTTTKIYEKRFRFLTNKCKSHHDLKQCRIFLSNYCRMHKLCWWRDRVWK